MANEPWAQYTIWMFRGVTIPGEATAVRHSEPFEPEHEYQRVLWRGAAFGKADALKRYKASKVEG